MINQDGLSSDFFFVLSQHRLGCDPTMNNLPILIPHTISYVKSIPQNWFFTDKQGILKRKHQKSLNLESIKEVFLRDSGQQGIVAQFVCQVNPQGRLQVEYLDQDDFQSFLLQPRHPDGLLQKFVPPYGEYNHLIECNWSENLMLLNKKQNLNKLANRKMDPYEKAVTFDGPEFLSCHVPLSSPSQIKGVNKMMQSIHNKLNVVSLGKYKVNRLVCYFKNNQQNQVVFQFCAALRLDDYLYAPLNQSQKRKHAQTPLNYQNNFKLPEFVNKTFSIYSSRPKQLKCDVKCINCEQYVQQWQLVQVPYKIIINYHDKFNSNTMMATPSRVFREPNETEKQNQNDRVVLRVKTEEQADDTLDNRLKDQQDHKLQEFIRAQHKIYYQQKEQSEQKRIPKVFQIVQQDLTYDQYLLLKTQADFRGKLVQTCNSCYMLFLGELHLAGKEKIFYKNNHALIKQISSQNSVFKEMRRKYENKRMENKRQDSKNRFIRKEQGKGDSSHVELAQEQNYFKDIGKKKRFDRHVYKEIDHFIGEKSGSCRQHLRSGGAHLASTNEVTSTGSTRGKEQWSTRDIRCLLSEPF